MSSVREIINARNYKQASISDWQNFFDKIFSDRNKEHDYLFMWDKVVEHSTRLAEAIRGKKFFEASTSISRIFCWVCGFVSSNQDMVDKKSLEDLIWFKYPRTCNYCVSELSKEIQAYIDKKGGVPCQCGPELAALSNKKMKASRLKDYYENPRPITLDDWGSMFHSIFGNRIFLMSLDDICFHLFEEVGEVLVALETRADFTTNVPADHFSIDEIRKLYGASEFFKKVLRKKQPVYKDFIKASNQSIKEEIADVVSWLFSLVGKLVDLRNSLSNYEVKAYERLKEQVAYMKLVIDQGLIYPQPKQSSLKLSSILFLWYYNGCTICENLKYNEEKCQCPKKHA